MALPTVQQCRETLGETAEGMTDEQILAERDHLAQLAHLLFDQFRDEFRKDPNGMRELLHAHRHGVGSDNDIATQDNGPDEFLLGADDELGQMTAAMLRESEGNDGR